MRGALEDHTVPEGLFLLASWLTKQSPARTIGLDRLPTKKERQGLYLKDVSRVLFNLAVNTHVDDLENLAGEPKLMIFKRFLEELFGPVKLQRDLWNHVGAEYLQ